MYNPAHHRDSTIHETKQGAEHNHLQADVALLRHELFRSVFMKDWPFGTKYSALHNAAYRITQRRKAANRWDPKLLEVSTLVLQPVPQSEAWAWTFLDFGSGASTATAPGNGGDCIDIVLLRGRLLSNQLVNSSPVQITDPRELFEGIVQYF